MPDEFQFTPLREGRQERLITAEAERNISIHAPPRGATRKGRAHGNIGVFQFTPLREGRQQYATVSYVDEKFQFTPLREGRHNVQRAVIIALYFNSRPSARGD